MDVNTVATIPLFAGTPRRRRKLVARLADEVHVAGGETLVEEGRRAHEFFVIVSGNAEVRSNGHKSTIGPGDFFGAAGLLSPAGKHAETVVTTSDTRLAVMARREFVAMMWRLPAVAERIRRQAATRTGVRDQGPKEVTMTTPQEKRRTTETPFAVRIAVRGYELDANGHLNRAAYLQYAEHACWEWVRAAGIEHRDLVDRGVGPVTLEETIRYHRELRAGDEVTVACRPVWGNGKTYRIEQDVHLVDGTLVAEVTAVCGLFDLADRRLVPHPDEQMRSLAKAPEVLGL
jgi:acyl-CoA thioester hydrolase